jgi:hypothetical protein
MMSKDIDYCLKHCEHDVDGTIFHTDSCPFAPMSHHITRLCADINPAENRRLKQQLQTLKQYYRESQKVVGFYGDRRNWNKDSQEYGSELSTYWQIVGKDLYEQNQRVQVGGKTAREFQNSELNKQCKEIVDD